MACDATARLYDVDEDSVVFKKLQKTKAYDQGTVTFRARRGKLINLDKLHESIWATRLSGGTRSGLVKLQVTTYGRVIKTEKGTYLQVSGSDARFKLRPDSDKKRAAKFALLSQSGKSKIVRVTGHIYNYRGRWPKVLKKRPAKVRQIVVTSFQVTNVNVGLRSTRRDSREKKK